VVSVEWLWERFKRNFGRILTKSYKKVKNKNKIFYFYSKSPLLDVGGFAIKQGIKKYLSSDVAFSAIG
jgi:hypothetical protein